MKRSVFGVAFQLLVMLGTGQAFAESISERLALAGDNRDEIARALADVPSSSREGMEFLVLNMPESDLQTLSADFLLENTRLAYLSRRNDPWARGVPQDIFLNNVLPYASINERRDNWRSDFRKRCLPFVKDAKTASEAAAIINQKLFKQIGVKYSTKRVKADQSPLESMEGGLASCTGLSVILIDACRSVGIPARFVGTPLWFDGSGNHSWVEIWDDGWHFTGAAEPTGSELDKGWFIARASKAERASARHAVYATSFRKTPLSFPCVWNPRIKSIPALNVTDRYVALKQTLPAGFVDALFVVYDAEGQRVRSPLRIMDGAETVFQGETNDDRFDTNDHLRVPLRQDHPYLVFLGDRPDAKSEAITPNKSQQLHSFHLTSTNEPTVVDGPETKGTGTETKGTGAEATQSNATRANTNQSATAIESLNKFLRADVGKRGEVTKQAFANVSLTREDTIKARDLLAQDRLKHLRETRAEEMKARVLTDGKFKMPFHYEVFGDKNADGRSLYISMHGGGGAPKGVNDRQWENQKRLYQPSEGVYVAPRAPTDTWNLWHQGHIDPLFVRLIENMVAFEGVSWDRVYIMGYSAGGDGVYQLAPRLADRWAAASMMAGHPNETSPLGLRNVPFALQVGGKDSAYKRNLIAAEWETKLAELREADAGGYNHFVKIYPGKGHWMDREDAVALDWMAGNTRNPTPERIVWVQDDVTHTDSYWLGVDAKDARKGMEIVAEVQDQTIGLTASDATPAHVYLDDRFIDLAKPITIKCNDQVLYQGEVDRTIAALSATMDRRGDPNLSFPASVKVNIPAPFPHSIIPAKDLPRYSAKRTANPPTIDGRLDEDAWVNCEKTKPFVDLISGKETMHETRAAILWDDDYLYIGFWLDEPNVDAKYLNRDDPIYYDNDVEVFIAGKDSYYEFEINAHETVYEGFFVWQEAYLRDGYDEDDQLRQDAPKKQMFDGVGFKNHPRGKRLAFLAYDFPNFKSAVHIDGTLNDDSDVDQGWTVELAFPWAEMKSLAKGDDRALPPKPGDKWGIDLFRFNKYKAPEPAVDSGGWAWGKHGVWDSHIPEIFPVVTFVEE